MASLDAASVALDENALADLRRARWIALERDQITIIHDDGHQHHYLYHLLALPILLAILAFIAENSNPYHRVETDRV